MSTDPPSPAEDLYAGIQLTRPLLRNITARVEADLAGTGISVGQRAILEALLVLGPATAPALTEALQVSRQFVGRELKAMLGAGLVATEPNPAHRSAHLYVLTEASRRTIKAIRAREMAEIAGFAARFAPEEIAAFRRVQAALNAAFSSGRDSDGADRG